MMAFWFGVFGSVTVEVITIYRIMVRGRKLPSRYHHWQFWAARIALAIVGGILAHAYGADKPVLALHIGAAAPAIMVTLSQTPP